MWWKRNQTSALQQHTPCADQGVVRAMGALAWFSGQRWEAALRRTVFPPRPLCHSVRFAGLGEVSRKVLFQHAPDLREHRRPPPNNMRGAKVVEDGVCVIRGCKGRVWGQTHGVLQPQMSSLARCSALKGEARVNACGPPGVG